MADIDTQLRASLSQIRLQRAIGEVTTQLKDGQQVAPDTINAVRALNCAVARASRRDALGAVVEDDYAPESGGTT